MRHGLRQRLCLVPPFPFSIPIPAPLLFLFCMREAFLTKFSVSPRNGKRK